MPERPTYTTREVAPRPEEWKGAHLPVGTRNGTYGRPSGTRVDPETLRFRSRGGTVGRAFSGAYKHTETTTYYHSGINRGVFIEWISGEEAPDGVQMGAMVNARSAAQPSLLDAYVQYPEVPLVLDSGAFQDEEGLSVTEYMEVLEAIDQGLDKRGGPSLFERIDWVANLDVLGTGQIGTGPNFYSLREKGIEPLWIAHAKRTETERTTVRIEPPPERSFELQPGMTVGVGGLVPIIQENNCLAARIIAEVGEALSRHDLQGHFFGVGNSRLLRQFGDEPWFGSADSAKWLAGQKARKIYREDGSYIRAERQGLRFTRKECARQNLRQVAAWAAGTTDACSQQQCLFE